MTKKTTRQSLTYSILQDFDKKDWKALKDYFASPFFFKPRAGTSTLPDFVELLSDFYQNGSRKKKEIPNADFLLQQLYGTKKVEEKRINNLLSKLEEHLNVFFAHRKLKEDKPKLSNALAAYRLVERDFKDINTQRYVKNKLTKFERGLEKYNEHEASYWYAKFLLEHVKGLFDQLDKGLKTLFALRGLFKSRFYKFIDIKVDNFS